MSVSDTGGIVNHIQDARKELAIPAFLASAHSVRQLTEVVTELSMSVYLGDLEKVWQERTQQALPPPNLQGIQKEWDKPLCAIKLEDVKRAFADDPTATARLLAATAKESGAWLRVLPAASLGALLNDSTVRVSVALRLGAKLCIPHKCVCGSLADELGHHSLSSCKFSTGRSKRHAELNGLIQKALKTIDMPSELEPTGTSFTDATRPDGFTMTPMDRGKCAAWDVTAVCTLALSNISLTTHRQGAAAEAAEERKIEKYSSLAMDYIFIPLGVETFEPWGPGAKNFIETIGKKIAAKTGESRSTEFLRQRISIALQRFNAVCVLRTAPPASDLSELFFVVPPRKVFLD